MRVGAGCSSGGLSHAQFVKRAGDLCKQAARDRRALPTPYAAYQLVSYLEGARRIEERFLESARKLEPPREDAEDWRRALALDERLLRKFQRLHDALKRGDVATVSTVMDELVALPRHNVFEQRLGIQGCTSRTARKR